jgi:hypothetical protein
MSRANRAVRSALVVFAGALGIFGASSSAGAQRIGYAADPPPPPRPTVPYPGATVTIDPRWYHDQGFPDQRFPSQGRRHQRLPLFVAPSVIYYYQIPSGYGGAVYDANGRPLYSGFDAPAPGSYSPAPNACALAPNACAPAPSPYDPAPNQYWYPPATPDLSGSPYVVLEGGAMLVDFGYRDTRAIPSCGMSGSQLDPDGRPRTVFYTPPADSPILRAGSRGRVLGAPAAGARACYGVDAYGRMELRY